MQRYFMKIIEKDISELKAYKNNPRINDNAVDAVANSIKEFGFKNPIIIDRENVILAGHTRLKAAQQLGLKSVPCIVADDLTEAQIKAFRLADNKTAELAEWDEELLDKEIAELLDIDLDFDLQDFGFELDADLYNTEQEPFEDEAKENARVMTNKAYNLDYYDEERTEGKYQMPIITPVNHKPKDLIGFNYARTSGDTDAGIHFFLDDYQFERLWNVPEVNLEIISRYDCMLTPDFSLYLDMPIAMQIWNVYRSRMIGQIAQNYGIIVIPTVQWAQEETFEFCFDGLPKRSTLAVSTIGVKNSDDALKIWRNGMREMIDRLEPKRILIYGGVLDYDYGKIEIASYKNHVIERMSEQ